MYPLRWTDLGAGRSKRGMIEGPITIACVIGRPWIESFTALGEQMMDSTLTS